jgi:flagellar basal-body rod protein FlgB
MIDRLSQSLEHYLDLLSARQKVIASNIANADTPGYRIKDIDFQSEFRNSLRGGTPHTVEIAGLPIHNDGSNVNVDREARLLSENAMRFNLVSNLLRSQVQAIRTALQPGSNT